MNFSNSAVEKLLYIRNHNMDVIKLNAKKHYMENFADTKVLQDKHEKIYKEVYNDNN